MRTRQTANQIHDESASTDFVSLHGKLITAQVELFVFKDSEAAIKHIIKGRPSVSRITNSKSGPGLVVWQNQPGPCNHDQIRQHNTTISRHSGQRDFQEGQTDVLAAAVQPDVTEHSCAQQSR